MRIIPHITHHKDHNLKGAGLNYYVHIVFVYLL
jgi:hypothetical protein